MYIHIILYTYRGDTAKIILRITIYYIGLVNRTVSVNYGFRANRFTHGVVIEPATYV